MKNKKVNLDDICFFQEGPGVRKHQYCNEGIKLINVSNLVNGEIDLSNSYRYISQEEAYGRYKHFLIDEGDLIIASSGIKVEYLDKKVAFIRKEHLPLCMNTSTIRFKVKNRDELDLFYLSYFLKSKNFKNQISKLITGSAQLNFGSSHLKKISLFLPKIDFQKKVSNLLLLIDNIIKSMQKKITFLELLKKSLFKKYSKSEYSKILCIKDIASKLFAGGDKPVDYSEKINKEYIYPVYSNGEKKEGLLCFSKNFKVDEEALTISARGTIGFTTIRKPYFTPVVRLITLIPNKNNNINYLKYAIDNLNLKASGSSIGQLTVPIFSKYKLNLPPIELQNKFAERIEKIEKLKFEIEKSIETAQNLYDSLISKYFDN